MKGIILITILFTTFNLSAQVKHVVQSQETLYGLSKKYDVSQQAIMDANPGIAESGLKIGMEIIIPSTSGQITNNSIDVINPPLEDDMYQYITIQPKETLFNLSQKYNISIQALKSLNPNISEGLKEGDVVRVPKSSQEIPEGYHKVQPGETLYTLSREYNVPVEDILIVNRNLQVDNLQIGQYIKIPQEGLDVADSYTDTIMEDTPPENPDNSSAISSNTDPSNPSSTTNPSTSVNNTPPTNSSSQVKDGYYEYTVKQGETLFTLLTKFDLTLEEFINSNPEVTSTVVPGQIVYIPLKSEEKFNAVEPPVKEMDDTIRVAVFLPFFLEDETKKGQKELSTFFLSGVKLALDSISAQGKKIKVEVVDSGNEQLFQRVLDSGKIYNADLYIGPFYKGSIMALRQKTLGTNVPIVSPLVKTDALKQQPYIIFPNIDDFTLSDKLMQEVNSAYTGQKIILVSDDKSKDVANYILNKFTSEGKVVEIVYSPENINQEQNLITEKHEDLILVLVTESDYLGQKFIDKLDTLNSDYITPFSVFYLNSFDKTNNISKLRKSGFVFIADRKVNTKGYNEVKTLKNYESEYCQSPPKYAVIGFDIVYDLLTRIDSSKNILNHMATNTTQLASKFEYQRLPSNSYENKGVRVVRYTKLTTQPEE